MTEEEKKAERGKLFELFADGTTVGELFQYLEGFDALHRDDLPEGSPFYSASGSPLEVTIHGEKTSVQLSSLDQMMEYLLYDKAELKGAYKALRWAPNAGTYNQNVGDIKKDAETFKKEYDYSKYDIPGWKLADAAATIFKRIGDKSKDKKFWKNVLGDSTEAAPAPTLLRSAEGMITGAIEDAAKGKKCVVFTGAPGTGKTYCVEKYVEKKMETAGFKKSEYFVQFHSSYDYTDFMEGLRPKKGDRGEMEFVRMDGIFKAFCRKVVALNKQEETNDEKTYYYFVIDEINRADLGRVFGELMYCFEKRGEEIATQYANLDAYGKDGKRIENDCFKGGFYIPENVVIVGTMNDIDRSVETFDFALRRRFDWIEIDANDVMESSLKSMVDKGLITGDITQIVEPIKKMNEVIAHGPGLNSAFAIGHAYFAGYGIKSLDDIWRQNIKPILKEYMRGRDEKKTEDLIDGCGEALLGKEAYETLKSKSQTQPSGAQQ